MNGIAGWVLAKAVSDGEGDVVGEGDGGDNRDCKEGGTGERGHRRQPFVMNMYIV